MFSAILRGFPTGYQGQPSEILTTLGQSFETRHEARLAALAEWKPLHNSWESVGRKIQVVNLDDPDWSYLAADSTAPCSSDVRPT